MDVAALLHRLFGDGTCSVPELLADLQAPWDIVKRCPEVLAALARRDVQGDVHPSAVIDGDVVVEPGAVVGPCAYILGPTIVRSGAVVRHGAYIRGSCLLEPESIVGHTTEVKNAVFLTHACAPHFAYVGDSVLGAHSNLGAGVKLANVRVVAGNVAVRIDGVRHDTGLRKLGALIGNNVKIGCNAVTNPGTILEADCVVYAGLCVSGHHAAGEVIKA